MIHCYQRFGPDILETCNKTLSNISINNIIHLSNVFLECRSISVDYAIMENICSNIDIIQPINIPYNGYWNDIGSFASLYNELNNNTQ